MYNLFKNILFRKPKDSEDRKKMCDELLSKIQENNFEMGGIASSIRQLRAQRSRFITEFNYERQISNLNYKYEELYRTNQKYGKQLKILLEE